MGAMHYPARAVVNLAAIRHNVATLAARTDAAFMAVVKADGYGHGAAEVARAAVEAGATWIGVAQATEALAIAREVPGPTMLTWIYSPTADLAPVVQAGIHISISTPQQAAQVAAAAAKAGVRAQVHLKIDTGMARGGSRIEDWAPFIRDVLGRRELEPVAVWSHLARADEPGEPTTAAQLELFERADAAAVTLGLGHHIRHLAASAGLMFHPATHLDLVRAGVAIYGLPPDGSHPCAHGLVPAMRLEAEIFQVKHVPAGTPVSYGHIATVGPTWLADIPLGYADGIPRQASNAAVVGLNGRTLPQVGRICMDQFVIDLGDVRAAAGDTVVLFGPDGPFAEDWARAAGTINYTIVTQLGPRVPRVYLDAPIEGGTWN